MDREDAILRLRGLVGRDLTEVARENGVAIRKNGRINKGWAGHAIERFLGLPLNSARSPNLGTWELKLASLKRLKNNNLVIKETMAITMLDPVEVIENDFVNSHLYNKLRKVIAVSRIWEGTEEESSVCFSVNAFELDGTEMYDKVLEDYELIRRTIRNHGFNSLTGKLGKFVQPRTKGAGNGSSTRAFYARKSLVKHIIGLQHSPPKREKHRSLDCSKHAGSYNMSNRTHIDIIMGKLPSNQSGKGRHKCAYCAYEVGYSDALAEIGHSPAT